MRPVPEDPISMPEETSESQAAAAPDRGSSKLLLIIVSALLAAGAAGGAVYFMDRGNKDSHAEGAAKQVDKAAVKAPAMYVKFDPPFVVNFEAKGMMRFLQVSIEVMTRDPATADMLKLHDPMLRNELLLLLGNQTYETISSREGKEQLRGRALEAVAKIIGEQGGNAKNVEQLYFTSFVMQ
jgi:flagellar protein FliL